MLAASTSRSWSAASCPKPTSPHYAPPACWCVTPGASSEQVVAVVRDAIAAARVVTGRHGDRPGRAAHQPAGVACSRPVGARPSSRSPASCAASIPRARPIGGRCSSGTRPRSAASACRSRRRSVAARTPGSPSIGSTVSVTSSPDLALEPDETAGAADRLATIRSASGGEIAAGELALWKLGATSADAELPVVAHVPELSSLPTPRDATARRRTVTFRYPATPATSTRSGCCCATGSGTSSAASTRPTSSAPIRVDRIRATCGHRHGPRLRTAGRVRSTRPVAERRQARRRGRRRGRRRRGPGVGGPGGDDRPRGRQRARAASPRGTDGRCRGAVCQRRPVGTCGLGLTDHAEVLGPPEVGRR